jgi:hypothetical protein
MCAQKSTRARREAVPSPLHRQFAAALDRLVARLQEDRTVLAAILCGSLAHDTVWARSDIDLVLVTVDDRQGNPTSATIDADGIHVHALIYPRTGFRKAVEGAVHNSFGHSFMAKGTLLFTHDPTIADLHTRLRVIGDRDTKVQLLRAAAGALGCIDKAHKFLITRGDLEYTALWILHAAGSVARLEVVSRGQLADREVIPQAEALNPGLFRIIYRDLLNMKKTRPNVEQALRTLDEYVRERAPALFALILEYLQEAGEARSCTELEDHFHRHYAVGDVTIACEYLAAEGLIGKASLPLRLTRKSTTSVPELAFFALQDPRPARTVRR